MKIFRTTILLAFLFVITISTYILGSVFIDISIMCKRAMEANLFFIYFISILYFFILSMVKNRILLTLYILSVIVFQFISMELPCYNFRFNEKYVLTFLMYFLSILILPIICALIYFNPNKPLAFHTFFKVSNIVFIILLFVDFIVAICT